MRLINCLVVRKCQAGQQSNLCVYVPANHNMVCLFQINFEKQQMSCTAKGASTRSLTQSNENETDETFACIVRGAVTGWIYAKIPIYIRVGCPAKKCISMNTNISGHARTRNSQSRIAIFGGFVAIFGWAANKINLEIAIFGWWVS